MFNTKGQEANDLGGISKSLLPGVVKAHIYSGEVKTSKAGDKKMLELILEGPELTDFEGWPVNKSEPEGTKFSGQSGRVQSTSWTDKFSENNTAKNEILNKLTIIANELGLRDDIDNIQANTIEEWAIKAINIVKGHDLYWFLKGSEEEYNGKTIIKLSLPKYKFASAYEDRLDKFDKTNQYHYRSLVKETVNSFEPNTDFEL